MVCQGHWGSIMVLDLQAGPSTMELVGYWTSRKKNLRHLSKCFSAMKITRSSPVVGMSRERR